MAFKYTFLQLSASSVVPLPWPPTPTPTQDSVPTGDSAKANSTEEVSLCYQKEREREGEREGGRDVLASPSVGPVRMCTQAVMTPCSCYVYDVAVS